MSSTHIDISIMITLNIMANNMIGKGQILLLKPATSSGFRLWATLEGAGGGGPEAELP